MVAVEVRVTARYELQRVASLAFGARGVWAYEAFNTINERYFGDQLPTPWIGWAITPHSACLASTLTRGGGRVPVITLHPSILGGTEKRSPWGISPKALGPAYAFDVLLHECIHVAVHSVHGYTCTSSETSHSNPVWIDEVNRIAPLVGYNGITAAASKVARVQGKVKRVCEGDVPFAAVASFPLGYRKAMGDLGYYWTRERHVHVPELYPDGW